MISYGSIKKIAAFFLLLILGIGIPNPECEAQLFDLQLEINAEVETQTKNRLTFGIFPVDAGRKKILGGSNNMGIFSISALEGETMLISIEEPKYLRNGKPYSKDKIPINLKSRYGFGKQDFRNTHPLHGSALPIKIASNNDANPWNQLLLFFYGSINIGNISDGVYSADTVLKVQYL